MDQFLKIRLLCLTFILGTLIFANPSEPQSNCVTTFKLTAEEVRTAHHEVVQQYFEPKRLFTRPFVKDLAKLETNTPSEILRHSLAQLDPKIIQAETGLEAVKALLAINTAAKVLGLSPKQYISELRNSLTLHRSQVHREISIYILDNLIPPLRSHLNSPKSAFTDESNRATWWVLSSIVGGFSSGLATGIFSGHPGIAILTMLGGVAGGGPFTLWSSTKTGFSIHRAVAIRNLYKQTRLMSSDEMSKKLVGTEFLKVAGLPSEKDFDLQIEKLVSLVGPEMVNIETLRLSVQVLSKHDPEYGRNRKKLIESPANQVYFDLWNENGGSAQTRQTLLVTLDALEQMQGSANPSSDSPFARETINKGEAIANFQSSSGWPKRQNFLTPVIILSQGKSPNTWLAASPTEFNDALKFRNNLNLFELKQEKLNFETQPSKITRYKSGNPRLLYKDGSHQSSVLIPPEFKLEMAKDPTSRRKQLRDFLVQQYFNP